MIRGEMRVAPHHLRTLPAAQLLQREQRRAALHVPVAQVVPQIVPAEILDAGPLSAAYQAFVLTCLIGFPRKLNTYVGCFPTCCRTQRHSRRY